MKERGGQKGKFGLVLVFSSRTVEMVGGGGVRTVQARK